MKKYIFNKLIRNKLPPRMLREGISLKKHSLNPQEFILELKNKLVEEAKEVRESSSKIDMIKELADVMEVIETLKAQYSVTWEEIENERLIKLKTNGEFLSSNYIVYIEVPTSNQKVIDYLENKNRSYKYEP